MKNNLVNQDIKTDKPVPMSYEALKADRDAQAERARHYSVNFRTAERFGLVEVKNAPVVFWFERAEAQEKAL